MTWLLYGANGYTGELCAREAVRRGFAPILCGRNGTKVERLASELRLPHRVASLSEAGSLKEALAGVDAVLHCAGPFVTTSRPMIDVCLEAGVHYLDITGEIAVFEAALSLSGKARAAAVTLLPGVGFDVVPTDCLAARLAEKLPDATHLELAFFTDGGSMSRGTLKTMIEGLPHVGAIRENGRIRGVPIAFNSKKIDFSCGPRWATTIPWGDISTAFASTGIENIRVYSGTPPGAIKRMERLRPFLGLAGLTPIKRTLQWWVGKKVTGPDLEARNSARVYLWGMVQNASGERVTATFETPEGYAFTAATSVEAANRVVTETVSHGTLTPSLAFGSGFAETFDGTSAIEIQATS